MSFTLVREMGLEPTRQYWHKHLKLACLPIPASPQISLFIISDNFAFVKHKNLHFRFLFYAVAFTAIYLPAVTVAINVTLPKHLSSALRFRPRTRFPTQNTYPSNRTRWNPYIPHWTPPLLPPAQASRCNQPVLHLLVTLFAIKEKHASLFCGSLLNYLNEFSKSERLSRS